MEIKSALRILLSRKALSPSQPLVVNEFLFNDFNEARREINLQCKRAINNLWATDRSSCPDGTSHGRFELNIENEFAHYNAIFKENWKSQTIYHFITVSYASPFAGIFYTWSGSVLDLESAVAEYLHVMNHTPVFIET